MYHFIYNTISEVGKGRFHKIDKSFFILGEERGAWQIRFWYENNTVKKWSW